MEAVIFDMDGVLIDSEPFWRFAERKVFGRRGLVLTDEMCKQTTGMRIGQVVSYWREFQTGDGKAWKESENDIISGEILAEVKDYVNREAVAMEGVGEAIALIQQKGLRLAVASSSPLDLIEAVVRKLGLDSSFELLCSAENEAFGKPHPAVYLRAAERLGLPPERCLAIEDSLNGLIAAKAALMKTVVIPDRESLGQSRFDIADVRLKSLTNFDEACLGQFLTS